MPFTASKFLSLDPKARHKKIAERLRQFFYEPNLSLYQEILDLEYLLGIQWTLGTSKEALSNSFHRHWKETNLGLSEQAMLIKTQDKAQPKRDWLPYVIYLDHLRSAENIGSILRTIEAFRLGKVAFSDNMPTLHHPKVQKTSMGAYQKIEIYTASLEALPRPWIALETHQKSTSLEEFHTPDSGSFFFGNEEYGLSSHLLEQMDEIVEVPLVGCKNSLNVAACFGLVAWEIVKANL